MKYYSLKFDIFTIKLTKNDFKLSNKCLPFVLHCHSSIPMRGILEPTLKNTYKNNLFFNCFINEIIIINLN